MESATIAEKQPTRIVVRERDGALGVAAVSPALRLRIASALTDGGLLDVEEDPGLVEGGIGTVLRHSLAVLVYAGDITAKVVRAIQQARQRQPDLRVVVVVPAGRMRARHAIGYAIDGVVDEESLETALSPTVRTVLAGQAVLPGSQASELIAPNLSHREKEVLILVALGLANADIAKKLFLAKSTVKSHLTLAFGKLGVSSRSEAAALILDRETAVGRSLAVPLSRERATQRNEHPAPPIPRSPVAQVPFVDLQRQHASLAEELRLAFDRVAAASAFTLGEEVELFEADFASYCEVAHCVGVASGTAALTLALAAAGIGQGDEVIVPAHTFIASALAVIHAGATPVLCDVEDASGLISVESAATVVTERTAGLIAVHLYGQVCPMTSIGRFAERHGLAVFEDAAQAHGATSGGRRAGSFGTAAGFSFYPSKNLGALGDGGAICTNDAVLAERARQLRHLGQRSKGEHLLIGVNERLDGLQAALLRVKLPHLDAWNAARARCAERYRQGLRETVAMPICNLGETTVNHVFPIRLRSRDAVADALRAQGVQTGIHYDRALHQHVAFKDIAGMPPLGALPASEAWAREELSLPMFPELEMDEVDRVVEVSRKVMDDDGRVERS